MKIKLKCTVCNKNFYRIPSRSWAAHKYKKEKLKYCSRDCGFAYLKKLWSSQNERKKRSIRQLGKRNSNYKNGLQQVMGYIWINYTRPHKHKITGRIPRAVYVMEQFLGRRLTKQEVVHHIDKNKKNDDIKNLMLFKNSSDHMKYHGKMRTEKQMNYMRSFIGKK